MAATTHYSVPPVALDGSGAEDCLGADVGGYILDGADAKRDGEAETVQTVPVMSFAR